MNGEGISHTNIWELFHRRKKDIPLSSLQILTRVGNIIPMMSFANSEKKPLHRQLLHQALSLAY